MLACAAVHFGLAPPAAAQARTRVIILSFEGTHADEARAAVDAGLAGSYELVAEATAIGTAAGMHVDASTPEGLAAVIHALGVDLVIGGSVSGSGRRAETQIWVADADGRQLATRIAGPPTGRGAADALAAAAREVCAEAERVLHPSSGGGGPVGVPQGDVASGPPRPIDPNRWSQPLFRGTIGLDVRNISAGTRSGADAPSYSPGFVMDPRPLIALWLETRPFAQSDDALRGLYAALSFEAAAGLTYLTVDGNDPGGHPLNVYAFGLDLGYAGTISEIVEVIGTLGFGVDGFGLGEAFVEPRNPYTPPLGGPTVDCSVAGPPASCASSRDYPSVQMWFVRPAIQARVRLLQDLVILEGAFGGRIAAAWGDLQRSDFGAPSGGGIDWSLGLAGIVDPGFAWQARFGYSGAFITYGDPGGAFPGDLCAGWCSDAGTIEAWHFTLGVGWALR